jgi:HPr Serine kinase C-terminal domain
MIDEALATQTLAAASPPIPDYFLCGWRVRSVVVLPEALPWTGDDRPPDVTIRFGSAPPLPDPSLKGEGPVQVGRDGVCRLDIKHIAGFLVVEGREVIVEPRGGLDTLEFRSWLLGPVLGMLCHQRGLFPLHAACIRIGDRAAALVGPTGVGKSTLAAALVRRGHTLVADDVCVIDPPAPGGPWVLPSFPRLKLWDDALQTLDISAEGMPRAPSGKRKFHFCEPDSFDPSPVRLHGVYILDRSPGEAEQAIQQEGSADAAALLFRQIYRRPIGFHVGRRAALLTEALRIASLVPVFRFPLMLDLRQLGAAATQVEAHIMSLGTDRRERYRRGMSRSPHAADQNSLPEKFRST